MKAFLFPLFFSFFSPFKNEQLEVAFIMRAYNIVILRKKLISHVQTIPHNLEKSII